MSAEAAVEPLTLVVIPACAVAAPLLADRVQRWLSVPTVVFEIVLGVLIGPDVLGWASVGDFLDALSQFGLAMLMFLAGYEIDFIRLRGGPLRRAVLSWLVSLALALGFGALVNPDPLNGAFAGLVLTTTALGTILPILRDSGDLPTALPLVVVITTIEVDARHMHSSTAAALVGAGMLSVLLFPLLAQRLRGETLPPVPKGEHRVRAESW